MGGVRLIDALEAKAGQVIALVGAGGKTTLMFRLARGVAANSGSAICTTTTKIFRPSEEAGALLISSKEEELFEFLDARAKPGTISTICSRVLPDGKLKGIEPEFVDRIKVRYRDRVIIVEADGAQRKPIKAPGPDEPVIPLSTDTVVGMVGIDALGRRLDGEVAFRADMICRITGLREGETIGPGVVASLFLHPEGLFKGAPRHSRLIAFINKVDTDPGLVRSKELAQEILKGAGSRVNRVVLGCLKEVDPVAAIVERGDVHE